MSVSDERQQQRDGGHATSSEVENLQEERDRLVERLARTQAEFENSRKRLEREQQEYRDFALADAVRSLLPSLDSLDWALQSPVETLDDLKNGVELIRRQLHSAFEKLGVSPIPAKGETFDPRVHEAVDLVDMEAGEPNTIVEELRPGYKLGDRLLRPAMVLVTSNKESKKNT